MHVPSEFTLVVELCIVAREEKVRDVGREVLEDEGVGSECEEDFVDVVWEAV